MKKLVYLIFICLCGLGSLAQAQLSLEQIVQKALDQEETMRQRRQVYKYDLTVVTEKLDRDDKVGEKQTSRAVVRPDKEISIELEGDSSNEKRVKESQKIMAVMNLKKLAPRFQLSLGQNELMGGRECYVIHFDPKPDQPYDSREEKIVNLLAGRFWIAKKNFSIVRSEGKLTEPTSVAWVFATMREVRFLYRTKPLPNGDLGPASFEMLYDLQTVFAYRRRLQTSVMQNYRLAQ